MHLEDVTIEGFKSFSEPASMSFQPGIGVIIGNNGVGKSNILDAIVWALGEEDVNRLRCHASDELFFAGSKSHPPADRVRVDLCFKDGDRELRLARETDRTGGQRYQIDGADLAQEEFRRGLATMGLTHALKTIIRQERINDLLHRSPAERLRWTRELLGGEEDADRLVAAVDVPFRRYLDYLFPEGRGALTLAPDGEGAPGLELEVTLPGNRRRKAHQLSGGEKAVTSLALQLALFEPLDSPFYLLDEVEPSLDYANHKSMQALLRDLARTRQLIMITHLRSTIELADTVHGARTRWDGSSFMKFHFLMDERLLRLYARAR